MLVDKPACAESTVLYIHCDLFQGALYLHVQLRVSLYLYVYVCCMSGLLTESAELQLRFVSCRRRVM